MNIIIPENYFYLFESVGERCVLPSKTVIFYESDDANDIYLLIKGRVRAYLSNSQGTDYLGGIKERTYFW